MRTMLPLFAILFFSSSIFSQQIDFKRALVARKNHNEFVITAGKKYCVSYLENGQLKKIKLYYVGVSNDSVYFSSRNGTNETAVIVDAIQTIRKSSSNFRLAMGIMAATSLVGTAKLVSMGKEMSRTGQILIMPLTGLSVFSICMIPISLATDLLTEKRIKDGWSFSIRRL